MSIHIGETIMSKILASILAAGFALGMSTTMAETSTDGSATAWTDCDTLTGQDRALCQKASEFSKKAERSRDSTAPVQTGEATMSPTRPADSTDELKTPDARKQQGDASSSSLPQPEKQN